MKIALLFVCLVIGGIVVEAMGARLKRAAGGVRIEIEQAPYVVSLRRSRRDVCGGALISTQHVLTAAHCVYDGSNYLHETRVVCGKDEVEKTDIGHKIKNITKHRDYENYGMFWCDIAVVTLSAHVQRNDRQREIALSYAEPPYGKHATLSAFKTHQGAERGLQQFTMIIQKTIRTSINADYYDQGFDGLRKYAHFISNSDCGGPLVVGGRLIGILTNTPEGSRASYFVNVVKFIHFIEECMGDEPSLNSNRPPVILWAQKHYRL